MVSEQPRVVTFASASYLPLLAAWSARLRQLGIRHVRVYCLDAPTAQWCGDNGLDAQRVFWSGELRDLWIQRIRVFHALLEAGEGFVHSDIDAIWVRNPFECGAASTAPEDLLFSQGTVWPPDIHRAWGFVLCCGWFRARSVAPVRSFFQELEAQVRDTGDDQIAVNRLVQARAIRWSVADTCGSYQLPFREQLMSCWSQALRGVTAEPEALSVALLPHREFQRLPEHDAHAVIKHFLTPKNCTQKLAALRAHGLLAPEPSRAAL